MAFRVFQTFFFSSSVSAFRINQIDSVLHVVSEEKNDTGPELQLPGGKDVEVVLCAQEVITVHAFHSDEIYQPKTQTQSSQH